MRRSTKHINVWCALSAWFENVASICRAIVPPIMLYVLVSYAQGIYLPSLGFELTAVHMRCITIALHSIAMWYGFRNECSRGSLYELCCCFLPTEIVLFLYFTQHQFLLSIILLSSLVIGAIWIFAYGRNQLDRLYQYGYVPQCLMDDIIASSKNNQKNHSLTSVALRRYLTIGTAFACFIPSVMVATIYGTDGVVQFAQEYAIIDETQDNQLLQNYNTILLFQKENWPLLTEQEKVNALQVVADIETNYMGIQSVVVVNCHLENRTIGAYDHSRRQVQIDLQKHEGYDPEEYLNTLLHECRHAYQHDCIDSLDWSDPAVQAGIYYAEARKWRFEHANYISLSEDRDAYYRQAIESDARRYADEGVYVYQQYIDFSNLPAR